MAPRVEARVPPALGPEFGFPRTYVKPSQCIILIPAQALMGRWVNQPGYAKVKRPVLNKVKWQRPTLEGEPLTSTQAPWPHTKKQHTYTKSPGEPGTVAHSCNPST